MEHNILSKINDSKTIAIFSHINPDADALCSAFALKNIIMNNFDYKYPDVFIDGEIGELYSPIVRRENLNPIPYEKYDMAFVLDCPNLSRIGKYQELIKKIPIVVNIDHHETNEKFGSINYASPKVSSTCELIYLMTQAYDLEINNLIAKELYQGILTDTNCFTSLTASARTYRVVGELMKNYKFDPDVIKEYYFKNNTIAKTRLLTKALQSMRFYANEHITVMKIPYEAFDKFNASFEDTLGIIDNGINIDVTYASAIIIEKEPGKYYCSLRSKGQVNVGDIAKQFGGGGSEKIAAFQSTGDIREIEKQIVQAIEPYIKDVKKDELIF